MIFTKLTLSEPQRNWLGETDIAAVVVPFHFEMNQVNSTGYTVAGYVIGIETGLISRSDIVSKTRLTLQITRSSLTGMKYWMLSRRLYASNMWNLYGHIGLHHAKPKQTTVTETLNISQKENPKAKLVLYWP